MQTVTVLNWASYLASTVAGDNNVWTGFYTSRPSLKRHLRHAAGALRVLHHSFSNRASLE